MVEREIHSWHQRQPFERIEAPVLQRVETRARLAYPFRYVGDADLHLAGQPCDVLAGASKSTDVNRYLVAFACGCREVVAGWTLSSNSIGVQ